ncbi:hypothetical protein O1611_g5992 [Lasiodiplodia mahajangana]|uniref:Uncharacterized protein n=1 Tax=Lasiodiplodia mahajangana TaxID=1108764 RepID=A0ACC2JJZ0_9PEZI|nr:hypothetical protein O1611_g5992 [Lasiodiplodia mahajangana]
MAQSTTLQYLTKDQFEAKAAEIIKESSIHTLVEMSDEEARLTEELLDIEKGTLPKVTCRFEKGKEHCPNCGRHYSILDKAKTGLGAHGKKFMADTLLGKNGQYVWNETTQPHNCFSCDHPSPIQLWYINAYYGCGN